ncbi:hypothetical protein PLESTB_001809700 [Pleodorina starrii]|uniref:Uncharacterized protein n=1 Tax=Pleodorina starrii TaxID=330485 RepID=A0A9W6FAI7_9CHLO|nr:hypothetical protein PLESTB_001809700 [Pleodorina starrii]
MREVRVWPGAGGLELFRLQMGALIEGPVDFEYVTFVVEATGNQGRPTPPLLLPGLASYGVASYCAAIGEALATRTTKCTTAAAAGLSQFPAAVGQHHHHAATAAPTDTNLTPASGPGGGDGDDGGDDWIELLCSVADLMEGKETAEGEGGGDVGYGLQPLAVMASGRGGGAAAAPPSLVTVAACIGAAAPAAARGAPASVAAAAAAKAAVPQLLPYDGMPWAPLCATNSSSSSSITERTAATRAQQWQQRRHRD